MDRSRWCWALPGLVLLLAGCVTVEKQYIKPSYDQSHAVLIERTVADLAVAEMVQSYVRSTEKVVVANIERTTNDDFFLTYMVDDHLIANLTQAGYKVLERDEDMIVRLMPEQSPTYKRKLLRTLPMDPALVLMDNIEKEGLDYVDPVQIDEWERVSAGEGKDINLRVDRVNLADVLTFYKDLKTDYRAIESEIKMTSADVIIAYRVLECGIVYD
ncbi:MAG: hypothetical protein JW820_03645, partial [Spirochaetales bacterium]|nr:hypothetical protein [Spirochaetales bacterium]